MRFAVPDSGAHGKVCYSTHMPNLKSVASSTPEILNLQTCMKPGIRAPLATVKHYLPPPTSWRVAGNNDNKTIKSVL